MNCMLKWVAPYGWSHNSPHGWFNDRVVVPLISEENIHLVRQFIVEDCLIKCNFGESGGTAWVKVYICLPIFLQARDSCPPAQVLAEYDQIRCRGEFLYKGFTNYSLEQEQWEAMVEQEQETGRGEQEEGYHLRNYSRQMGALLVLLRLSNCSQKVYFWAA